MVRLALSVVAYLLANAIGLLIAAALLPGFRINALSFLLVVLTFSIIQTVLGPLVTKIAFKSLPQLMGGIALVTIFIGLWITDLLMNGMAIGGISNWLAATLLVWVGSLIATILLPIYVFKELGKRARSRGDP
jgi:hypothetical protein